MLIIEITHDERAYVLDMAELLMPQDKRQKMAHRLTNEAVRYEGAFMVSITEAERTWITTRAEATMTSMAKRVHNAWMTADYAMLENLLYSLHCN